MAEEGFKEYVNLETIAKISMEVCKAIAPVIDKYLHENVGCVSIMIGVSEGVRDLLFILSKVNDPKLNDETVVKFVSTWMQKNIKEAKEEFKEIAGEIINEYDSRRETTGT